MKAEQLQITKEKLGFQVEWMFKSAKGKWRTNHFF